MVENSKIQHTSDNTNENVLNFRGKLELISWAQVCLIFKAIPLPEIRKTWVGL